MAGLGVAARAYSDQVRRQRESIGKLRASWGTPGRNMGSDADSALYHDLCSQADDTWCVDDRTWRDLFIPEVFPSLNHTRSRVGSQMLYRLLRCPSFTDDEIARRDKLIRLFSENQKLREQLQQALDPLRSDDAALLPNLFFSEMPLRPAYYRVFPALTMAMAASILAAIAHPVLFLGVVALMIVNIVVAKVYRDKVDSWIQPLRVLNTLVRTARMAAKLAAESGDKGFEALVLPIVDNQDALVELDRTTKWLLFERNSTDNPLMLVIEYINMILLLDVNSFVFGMEAVRKYRGTIRALFEVVGTVDSLIAVASYRHSLKRWCTPEYRDSERSLEMENGIHPLIQGGVSNSLTISQKGVLVTGSNMSGKTTFIRTIGVNALLGQSIATCTADRFVGPLVGVQTSIGRSDSLTGGKSYYMDEVDAIGGFLTDSDDTAPCLFIIDEIFHGTNTTERVAASRAVLDRLNRANAPHIVIVSTHDVELSTLLKTHWDRYHFRESVVGGNLEFDYTLRPGLSSTRNALRLLAARGYPAEVVKDAEETAMRMESGLEGCTLTE